MRKCMELFIFGLLFLFAAIMVPNLLSQYYPFTENADLPPCLPLLCGAIKATFYFSAVVCLFVATLGFLLVFVLQFLAFFLGRR